MISRRCIVLLAAVALAGCDKLGPSVPASNAARFQGVDITGAEYGRQLALTDQDGVPRNAMKLGSKLAM